MLAKLHRGTGEKTRGLWAGSHVGDGWLECGNCGEKIRSTLKPGPWTCGDCHATSEITQELINQTRGKNGKYDDEDSDEESAFFF